MVRKKDGVFGLTSEDFLHVRVELTIKVPLNHPTSLLVLGGGEKRETHSTFLTRILTSMLLFCLLREINHVS